MELMSRQETCDYFDMTKSKLLYDLKFKEAPLPVLHKQIGKGAKTAFYNKQAMIDYIESVKLNGGEYRIKLLPKTRGPNLLAMQLRTERRLKIAAGIEPPWELLGFYNRNFNANRSMTIQELRV